MVSIVVINHGTSLEENREIRCLSSLGRQSYTDLEIYTQEDKDESFGDYLNRVINRSSGKYIMFINPTIVMAPNVIETLIEIAKDGQSIPSVPRFVNINSEKSYSLDRYLYGKLFPMDYIKELRDEDSGFFCTNSEFTFWLRTKLDEERKVFAEDLYIYGEQIPLPQDGDLTDIIRDSECRWISLLSHFSGQCRIDLIHTILEQLDDKKIVFYAIEELARQYPDDNNTQLYITNSFVKNFYKEALSGDEDAYLCCKSYLTLLSSKPELVEVLLPVIGISHEQKKLMDQYDMNDYVFFYNKLPIKLDPNVNGDEIRRLETLLETQINKLDQIGQWENLRREADEVVSTNNSPVNLEGPALADFTVGQYAEGKLGFRTIWGSIKAWMKHKI